MPEISNNVRFVFFDLMETLIDFQSTQEGHWDAMAIAAQQLGHGQRDEFRSAYAKITLQTRAKLPDHREFSLEDRLHALGVPSSSIEKLIRAYTDYYIPRTRLMPGVAEMLAAWRGQAKLAVVSNFFTAGMPELLCQTHGIDQYFDFIVDSAQVGWRKPHVAIYQTALGMAQLKLQDAGSVIFVGDNAIADIAGPSALGFKVAHYGGNQPSSVPSIEHWSEFRPSREAS